MNSSFRFLAIGYGLATVFGSALTYSLGMNGSAFIWGGLTAWLGGAVLSLLVAFLWWKTQLAQAEGAVPVMTDTGMGQAYGDWEGLDHEYQAWDQDLASEAFESDFAQDLAEQMDRNKKTG